MTPAEMIRLFRDGKKEYTESEVRLIIAGTFFAAKEACAKVCEDCSDHIVGNDLAAAIRELNVDSLDISPERVEKTPKRIHMRQAGSFSANY